MAIKPLNTETGRVDHAAMRDLAKPAPSDLVVSINYLRNNLDPLSNSTMFNVAEYAPCFKIVDQMESFLAASEPRLDAQQKVKIKQELASLGQKLNSPDQGNEAIKTPSGLEAGLKAIIEKWRRGDFE